jgi:hypothetical protein
VHLIVVKPFGGFKRGDIITDQGSITKILNGQYRHFVVTVGKPHRSQGSN